MPVGILSIHISDLEEEFKLHFRQLVIINLRTNFVVPAFLFPQHGKIKNSNPLNFEIKSFFKTRVFTNCH
jgi:hypothetical protein